MPDTIVAPATPPGQGGVAIVRLSGPDSLAIASKLFRGRTGLADTPDRLLTHGRLVLHAGSHGSAVTDDVLVSVMRAPHSFTREDVVEINCHGGARLVREIVDACCALGAREAERGEFTERAFLNGRIDLAQAESVLDMVRARTREGLAAACYGVSGALSSQLASVRDGIMLALSSVEVGLEFAEDQLLDVGDPREQIPRLRGALQQIQSLRSTYRRGRLATEGAPVAITGAPNVGKSSLLNAILGEERAIVSPTPGTTRDLVEAEAELGGVRVRFVDTAGLRAAGDEVEREGTRRAELAAREADLSLTVFDASGSVPLPTGLPEQSGGIVVLSKMDIADPTVVTRAEQLGQGRAVFHTSAVTGEGVAELCDGIREALLGDAPEPAGGVITRERHARALDECAGHVNRAISEAEGAAREELVAADLRHALDALGRITGETAPDDVLRAIFDEFCIGK